jgi:hypothetical protein
MKVLLLSSHLRKASVFGTWPFILSDPHVIFVKSWNPWMVCVNVKLWSGASIRPKDLGAGAGLQKPQIDNFSKHIGGKESRVSLDTFFSSGA